MWAKKSIIDPRIEGVGTDIIEVDRIEHAINRYGARFLNRLFTKKEQQYCLKYKKSARHFAGRFAAKEALLKAMGTGLNKGTAWKELEILNQPGGKPDVFLSDRLKSIFPGSAFFLSISHCEKYATAFAIWVQHNA